MIQYILVGCLQLYRAEDDLLGIQSKKATMRRTRRPPAPSVEKFETFKDDLHPWSALSVLRVHRVFIASRAGAYTCVGFVCWPRLVTFTMCPRLPRGIEIDCKAVAVNVQK